MDIETANQTIDSVLNQNITLKNLLIIISSCGFFGGAVSAIFEFASIIKPTSKDNSEMCTECALFLGKKSKFFVKIEMILLRSIIGIAGAFAIVLLGLWSGKLTIDGSLNSQLILISLCIISGVISFHALPQLGNKIQEQILQKKISSNEEKSNTALKMSYHSADLSSALSYANTALQGGETYTPEIPSAITRLEELKMIFPRDRTLHIYLGRLYRKNLQYDKAICVLRKYIENLSNPAWTENHQDKNKNNIDIADAYYNIACYHALKLKIEKNAHEIERYKNEIFADLKKSFDLNPNNIDYAKKDNDLSIIHSEQNFISITNRETI